MTAAEENTKIVVGLGNPGERYDQTRHNVGFEVINELASRMSAGPGRGKFEGDIVSSSYGGVRWLLVRPLTFMNLSGRCVAALVKFYKVDPEKSLLIVCDDISLPLGKLRIRGKGSAGGQKGLNHILQSLGTQSVARLRIGVGEPPPGWDAADYVLGRFKSEEQPIIHAAVQEACDAVQDWGQHDLNHCMNRFN
ncbi:MAG: aminoacyl-tRNA hydrolase [bacterium]|nr:aminoacyl-tRNA hydrolase [bacterium]